MTQIISALGNAKLQTATTTIGGGDEPDAARKPQLPVVTQSSPVTPSAAMGATVTVQNPTVPPMLGVIAVDTLSVSSRTATPIQGFGNLCVKPQGLSSCPSADGTELFYRKQGQCQGSSAKFSLSSDGVLRQHCSRKKICPKGGQGGYGVPLVISGKCGKEQSKFERTTGRFSLKILIERLTATSVTHSDTDRSLT